MEKNSDILTDEYIINLFIYEKEIFPQFLIKDENIINNYKYIIVKNWREFNNNKDCNSEKCIYYFKIIRDILNNYKSKIKFAGAISYESEKYLIIYIRMLAHWQEYFVERYLDFYIEKKDKDTLKEYGAINLKW